MLCNETEGETESALIASAVGRSLNISKVAVLKSVGKGRVIVREDAIAVKRLLK